MAEYDWDKEGNQDIDRILNTILPAVLQKVEEALKETFKYAKYFISFQDLQRFIISKLEEKVRLSTKEKEYLRKEFEKIYEKAQREAVPEMFKFSLGTPDLRTISYAESLSDFYFGRFFRGDTRLRTEVVNWMNQYYLTEGNPIGRDTSGIQVFLNRFGQYLQQRTQTKARQIIDTTYNHLKNSARIRAFQKARITYYRWNAVGDRLTCPYCRSMDGRIFRTADAVMTLDLIEADPENLPDIKPFLTSFDLQTLKRIPSDDIPSKMPPAHPHCRCTVNAYQEEVERPLPITIESATQPKSLEQATLLEQLQNEYRSLKPEEISERIRAHLGSSWIRYSKENLLRNFQEHGHEVGAETIEQYKRMSKEIIKKADKVFIRRNIDGSTDYIFVKDGKYVISSDDTLEIREFAKLQNQIDELINQLSNHAAVIRVL
jgi:SPP1 gp7 family putative phage head morphogenesis protein